MGTCPCTARAAFSVPLARIAPNVPRGCEASEHPLGRLLVKTEGRRLYKRPCLAQQGRHLAW